METEDPDIEALAVLDAMALFATLFAAGKTQKKIAERQEGICPQDFLPKHLAHQGFNAERALLKSLNYELRKNLHSERNRTVKTWGTTEQTLLRFHSMMLLQDLSDHLQRIHHHAMSLYPQLPDIRQPEQLMEQFRTLISEAHALLSAHPHSFLDLLQDLTQRIADIASFHNV
ncbi:MAG TPA: hypothetical protein PLL64_11515 [Rhodothermales bacterium]|nr:hypothetical protein [Rhodothermales bacterium]HRR09570.1 hypothetical protein [Rhodothermales bacterium]